MSYRLELGLAALLAGAIGVAVWAADRSPKVPKFDRRTSTFLSGPRGSKGLHEVLVRLGRPSERRRTALFTLTDEHASRKPPAVLVVLNPPYPLQDAELDEVVEFLDQGGAVVAAGGGGGITRCAGWTAPGAGEGFRDTVLVRRPPESSGLRLPPATRVLAPWEPSDARERRLQGLVKGDDDEQACSRLFVERTDTVIAAVDGRPIILRLAYRGGGTLTLAADPGWFTNEIWRNTDAPVVLLPLVTPRGDRPGRVAWDEYHQGFGEERAGSLAGRTWSWLRESPAGWMIFQLIAVALLWLALTAVRFGPARAVIERRRRSPLEHLEALGAGLESAGDADTAVQRMTLGLRRRLSRTGQLGSGDVGPWLESLELAMRGPEGRGAVRRLRHIIIERGTRADGQRVLAAAQAVEDVWEELRPRKTREAF